MYFELTEEHKQIRESVRRFAERELAPIAEEIDREGRFPLEVYRKLGKEGFIGSCFPVEYGGGGSDFLSYAVIKEELVRVSAGFGMSVGVSAIFFGYNVLLHGTEEQRKKYLPPVLRGEKIGCWGLTEPNAGSDALAIETVNRKEGDRYLISGRKTFITNAPIADYFIVVTRDAEKQGSRGIKGGTTFLLERGTPGLSTGKPFDKLGHRCSPTSEVILEDVAVGSEAVLGQPGNGLVEMMKSLDIERSTASITSIAIARAALEAAVAYARERRQFGRPIAEFQLVQEKLAEIAAGIEIARTYAYKVIRMVEQGMDITREAAIGKLYASRLGVQAALEAVQIHGGYGFIKEYPVERYLRDSKLSEIGGGTSEIQKLIIARELLKER